MEKGGSPPRSAVSGPATTRMGIAGPLADGVVGSRSVDGGDEHVGAGGGEVGQVGDRGLTLR